MIELEGFVLIGGLSSRLGVDKAFVEIDGTSLAERAASTIERAFDHINVKFVARQFGRHALAGLGRPVINDIRPGLGVWSGVHAALAHTRCEWALVLACDYPLVSTSVLQRIVSLTDDSDAVVPVQPDGRLQPLCAAYRVRPILTAMIREMLDQGSSLPSLAAFVERQRIRRLEPAEFGPTSDLDDLFLNVNTREDLERARTLVAGNGGVAE